MGFYSYTTNSLVSTEAAATATQLATARKINNVPFDGSADIAIPGSGFAPSDHGWIAWNYDASLQNTFNIALTAGQTYLALLPIRAACTITNVIVGVVAGSGLTSGQNFAGLYNSAGTLLSATADQTTNWASTAIKVMALATPQAVTPGLYYVALLANGTTKPSPFYNSALNGTGGGGTLASTPRLAIDTTHTALTALRSTVTLTSAGTPLFWAAVS